MPGFFSHSTVSGARATPWRDVINATKENVMRRSNKIVRDE